MMLASYVLFKMASEGYHLMNTKAKRNELNKTDQEHYNNAVNVCINKQFKFQITKIRTFSSASPFERPT